MRSVDDAYPSPALVSCLKEEMTGKSSLSVGFMLATVLDTMQAVLP